MRSLTVRDILEAVENYNLDPSTEIRLQTQQNYPLEHAIRYRPIPGREVGYETDALYLVEGEQIGYGSRDFWEV